MPRTSALAGVAVLAALVVAAPTVGIAGAAKAKKLADGTYSGTGAGASIVRNKLIIQWSPPGGPTCNSPERGDYTIPGEGFAGGPKKKIGAGGSFTVHQTFPAVAGVATSPIATETGSGTITRTHLSAHLSVKWTFPAGGGCTAKMTISAKRVLTNGHA